MISNLFLSANPICSPLGKKHDQQFVVAFDFFDIALLFPECVVIDYSGGSPSRLEASKVANTANCLNVPSPIREERQHKG